MNLLNFENKKELEDFVNKLVHLKEDIYILGHINTDYDSIGSCSCLCYALNKIGKKAKFVINDDVNVLLKETKLSFYKSLISKDIANLHNSFCCILMDMNASYRAGKFENDFKRAKIKANIDHHNNNDIIADFKFVDSNSGANCENILKIILILENMFNIQILNKEISKMLLLGIITDTCNVTTSNNILQTKWAINILEQFGLNSKMLAEQYFYKLNKKQEKILALALQNKLCTNGFSYYGINTDNVKHLNLIHNDYSKVISKMMEFDKNTIIIFEQKFLTYSTWEFRSKDPENYPVNEIALKLGGGGHKNASGATILNLTSTQVIEKFLQYFNLAKVK